MIRICTECTVFHLTKSIGRNAHKMNNSSREIIMWSISWTDSEKLCCGRISTFKNINHIVSCQTLGLSDLPLIPCIRLSQFAVEFELDIFATVAEAFRHNLHSSKNGFKPTIVLFLVQNRYSAGSYNFQPFKKHFHVSINFLMHRNINS